MSEVNIVSLADLTPGNAEFMVRPWDLPIAVKSNQGDELYRQGLADGQCLAETAFNVERKRLHELIVNAEAIRIEDNPEIAVLLGSAVQRIVENLVGKIGLDPVFLGSQIDDAVALLVDADQARNICLHPDDIALLADARLPLPCKPDPKLPRGAILIECSAGWVEHGPASILRRLDRLLPPSGEAL